MSRDLAYVLDMLVAARRVQGFTTGASWTEFRRDDLVQNAVMHAIQTIGEAARMVWAPFRAGHPEVPWRDILAMRNRLVHDYFRIIPERVWEVVEKDIAPLIAQLEALVPPEEPSASQP